MSARHVGQFGSAVELAVTVDLPNAATTVCWWLLTGSWHPLWSQFVLCVVSLAHVDGVPDASLQFPGTTHELLVVALNPEKGHHQPASLEKSGIPGYLRPIDVVHQFTATDGEMRLLAGLAARACVDGALTPSTDDAREFFRERWLSSCVRTLAHMRGEEHGP